MCQRSESGTVGRHGLQLASYFVEARLGNVKCFVGILRPTSPIQPEPAGNKLSLDGSEQRGSQAEKS